MKFYTNVEIIKNKIYCRGYTEKGKRFSTSEVYKPTLFVPTKDHSKYKTLDGSTVRPKKFKTAWDAREYVKANANIAGFEVSGMTNFIYTYIRDNFPHKIYNQSLIRVGNIDIEVESENGFPRPEVASEIVNAITIKDHKGRIFSFGFEDYENKNIQQYIKCSSEKYLLKSFLALWTKLDFDIITGWNNKFFDIPYLFNRIEKVLGLEYALQLSPLGEVRKKSVEIFGKENHYIDLLGMSTLDYLEIYRKFNLSDHESYTLNAIAYEELKEKKLDYAEFATLHKLYLGDFKKFMDYNIHDTELVDKLEKKLKFIDMIIGIAYLCQVNFEDAFKQTKLWDSLIFNYLAKKNIVVPQRKEGVVRESYAGGYVKDPVVGMHKWVVSFDLTSLYPHLILQYNISPDTQIKGKKENVTVDKVLAGNYQNTTAFSTAANGVCFGKEKKGFLPEIIQSMYNQRAAFKKKMLEAEKLYLETNDEKQNDLKTEYNNKQMTYKVMLNSAYGAMGNPYFRFYDVDMAEAITLSGQLATKWIAQKLNIYLNRVMKDYGELDYIIASDTDSVYLGLDNLVKQYCQGYTTEEKVNFLDKVCNEKLEPFIEKCYKELADIMGAYEQKMFMKREVIADKGIWTAKKRYMLNVWDSEGIRYKYPKLKIVGNEAIKSSTPEVCRKAIKRCIRIIMSKDRNKLVKYVNLFKKKFNTLPFETVAFPRSINNIRKYKDHLNGLQFVGKRTPIHVRGSLLYNGMLEKYSLGDKYEVITNGTKIKFCYLKMPNPLSQNIFAVINALPPEFKLEEYIDHDTQYRKTFLEPLNVILDNIDWHIDEHRTLEEFFE